MRIPVKVYHASSLFQMLKVKQEEVLIESTGVIGQRIKKVKMYGSSLSYIF